MARMRSPILNSQSSEGQGAAVDQTQVLTAVSNLVGGLSTRIDRISAQMVNLSSSLQTISQTIATNAFLERQKETIEQERERRAAQQQLRVGQENLVERKIQDATVAPAQKAAIKAQSSLQNLMGFFSLLLAGWLGPKIVAGFKNAAKFTIDKLNESKDSFSKLFQAARETFSNLGDTVSKMFSAVSRTKSRVAQALQNGLFKAPIQFLRSFIQGTIDKVKGIIQGNNNSSPPSTPSTPSTSGTADSGTTNSGSNTNQSSTSTNGGEQLPFSPANALFGFSKSLLSNPALKGLLDIGSGMFEGDSPGQAVSGALSGGAFTYGVSKLPIPFPIKLGASILGFTPFTNLGKNFFDQFTGEEGGFYEGMNLKDIFSRRSDATSTNIEPTSTQTASVKATTIGPAPEPATNVIVTAGGQQGQREVPTTLNPSSNTIPNIASANSDNFYVYYSMANYNVVVA